MFPKKNISNSSIHWLLLFEFFFIFFIRSKYLVFRDAWLIWFSSVSLFCPFIWFQKKLADLRAFNFPKKRKKNSFSHTNSVFFFFFVSFIFIFIFYSIFFWVCVLLSHLHFFWGSFAFLFYICDIYKCQNFQISPGKKWNEQKKKIV